jgi:anti-sigma regulatory factor (Ser/Thr protein kinase)
MSTEFFSRGRSLEIAVEDPSQVGEARRAALQMAAEAEKSEGEASDIAIAATELASNLLKHAGKGHLLVSRVGRTIELTSIDLGPGMANVAECLSDGFSTAGTHGNGLGAIRRLASHFDFYTSTDRHEGKGTVLFAAFSPPTDSTAPLAKFDIGALCIPYPGELAYGDGWLAAETDAHGLEVVVADGLGHGPSAQIASDAALDVLRRNAGTAPAKTLELMHGALRSTRGAAVGLARIDSARNALSFAGVGNTVGAVCDGVQSKRVVSYDGTVGLQVRKIQEFAYAYSKDSVFVLHSDGLGTGWDLLKYPGLIRRHPSVIAGVLYRDFSRRKDDATVVVVRRRSD